MAEPTSERRDLVKRWMLLQLRQRLRSPKVVEAIDRWARQPDAPVPLRFEFVLNEGTRQTISNPAMLAALNEERI